MAVERELIQGVNMMFQGKEEGFNIFYSHTYNYVYGRAKMIMKNEDDALDLTQETFVQAYRGIQTLKDVNNVYAWLGSIVYNNGMKIYRKRKDVLVSEEAEGIFEDVATDDLSALPEASAEEKATSNIVMSMINELPEVQRAALVAYYYDNMKIDEIAEAFDCSSNTIKSRLNYAKKSLKEMVETHEKKYNYKLHSVSPVVIILALRGLFSGKEYVLAATAAQGVYDTACASAGFAPATVGSAAGTATATTSAATTATTATTAATTTAATTATTATVATAVATTGMALGTKIAIGVVGVILAGGVTVGGIGLASSGFFGGDSGAVSTEDSENTEYLGDSEDSQWFTDDEIDGMDNYGMLFQVKAEANKVDSIPEQEQAVKIISALFKCVGSTDTFDLTEITDEERAMINYHLLYNARLNVPTSSDDVGVQYGIVYDNDVLNQYLSAYYEGGNYKGAGNYGFIYLDEHTVLMPADGDTWFTASNVVAYQADNIVVLTMDCYENYNGDIEPEYRYSLYALLYKTDNPLSTYQLRHVYTIPLNDRAEE